MAEPIADKSLRVLYVPMLFGAERWNGIMEHLRILVTSLGPSITPALAVRAADGEQTPTLAQFTGMEVCRLGDQRRALELARACRRFSADIVHVHTPVAGGVPRLAFGARLARASVVVTYHQVQLERAGAARRAFNRIAQRALIGGGIAVSQAVRDSLAEQSGLDPSRLRIVYNGVAPFVPADTESAAPLELDASDIWLGYFGRLADEKLVDVLMRALVRARDREPRLRLLIVGDGYARERLQRLASDLALERAVVFAGHRPDARALMRRVTAVVHPARFEGLPYALVEATEAGRAIVGARAGGIPEVVVDGVNGLIVEPGDPEALTAAILRVTDDPPLRSAFERASRERYAAMFSSQRMADGVRAAYRAVR